MALNLFRTVMIVLIALAASNPAPPQPVFGDSAAITQFQRAADTYAFEHRKAERRVGSSPDQRTMAAVIRAALPAPADGAIFTPVVAAAFRARIAAALKDAHCEKPEASAVYFVVPRPNDEAGPAKALPACLAAVFPRLPAELEYRVVGVTLVLVDVHANLVVDVLHGAFPQM